MCFIRSVGPVTEVKTDIYVTSFGPVSDVEMVRMPCDKCTLGGGIINNTDVIEMLRFWASAREVQEWLPTKITAQLPPIWGQVFVMKAYALSRPSSTGTLRPPEQMLLLIPVPVLGVHHGCLLSTDMGGPKVDVRGPGRDIEAQ